MEICPITRDELRAALALILNLPGLSREQLRAQVEAFIKYAEDRPIASDGLYVAIDDSTMQAAAVRLDSPGRTALLFAPSMRVYERHADVVADLLRRLIDAGRKRGMRLFQLLLPPGSLEDARLLTMAGFERLAELIYMERPSMLPAPEVPPPRDLRWTTYDSRTHDLFARVIQATYAGSLDCPKLSGMRELEDIITGHKDTGEFDPRRWFVVLQGDRPAGCLLLSRVRRRSAFEIVYMGVTPQARGKGFAKTMLRHAITLSCQAHLAYLTLAVDSQNTPALSIYKRFGFKETIRRDAWVLTHEQTM